MERNLSTPYIQLAFSISHLNRMTGKYSASITSIQLMTVPSRTIQQIILHLNMTNRLGHYTVPKEMDEVRNWLIVKLGLEVPRV